MGKKHYQLKTYYIRRLVTYVEKGGLLESHKDVPEAIREELYIEEQQRLERDKRKGGSSLIPGLPYPPININVLPSQSPTSGLDVSAANVAVDSKIMGALDIPGPRDVAVKEYTCDAMLEDGLDLEQVYKDQDPEFFISKGIKRGIARRFVEDIKGWVENVKKAIPVYEVL
ncbi:unnamed protein product [Penicillium palitans]